MQQVKIFKSIESELDGLESQINQWIAESGARVISITGNIAPQSGAQGGGIGMSSFSASDVLLVVLYEKG